MLLNKVTPTIGKTVYYQVDGTGRDSYINTNSGGFFAKREISNYDLGSLPHPTKSFEKAPSLNGKSVIYQTDGTGRDTYVS